MKPIFESVASFPDIASAQLVREALVDGGLEEVEVQTVTSMNYMPRSHALDYEVRVPLVDVARAKLVLRDFQEEAERAAVAQAGGKAPVGTTSRRRRMVMYVAIIALIVMLIGPMISAAIIIRHFIVNLFAS